MKYTADHYADALLATIEKMDAKDVSQLAWKLHVLLIRRRHARLLPKILAACDKKILERSGTVAVTMTTTKNHDEQALQQQLHAVMKKPIQLHHVVDPALLGGAVIRIGDLRVDGSLRSRLHRLRTALRVSALLPISAPTHAE